MSKRIIVRELEPLEIVFRDKTLVCTLNNDALMLFDETYGNISEALNAEKNAPYSFASKILYCGIKVNNSDFTYEEAQSIIASGGITVIAEILDSLTKSFMSSATDKQKEAYLGELKRLMETVK